MHQKRRIVAVRTMLRLSAVAPPHGRATRRRPLRGRVAAKQASAGRGRPQPVRPWFLLALQT